VIVDCTDDLHVFGTETPIAMLIQNQKRKYHTMGLISLALSSWMTLPNLLSFPVGTIMILNLFNLRAARLGCQFVTASLPSSFEHFSDLEAWQRMRFCVENNLVERQEIIWTEQ